MPGFLPLLRRQVALLHEVGKPALGWSRRLARRRGLLLRLRRGRSWANERVEIGFKPLLPQGFGNAAGLALVSLHFHRDDGAEEATEEIRLLLQPSGGLVPYCHGLLEDGFEAHGAM